MFDFKFDWSPDVNTGIKQLDEHNKELFRVGRDMEQIILCKCEGVTESQLLSIVCDLREYVNYHFYVEEEYMLQAGYNGFDKHKSLHNKFRNNILNIDCPALAKNPKKELPKLKETVQDWVFEHILNEDRNAAKVMKKLPH